MTLAGKEWSASFAAVFSLSFVGYPLVSSFGSAFDLYSQGLSILLRAAVMVFSLGCIIAGLLQIRARQWADPALWVLFTLWLVLLLRFTWDASFVPIPLDLPWYEQLLTILGISLIPALALVHAPDESALRTARLLFVVMGCAAGTLVIYAFLAAFLSEETLIKLYRLSTQVLNPISVGHLGVTLVIAGVLAPKDNGANRLARIIDFLPIRILIGLLGAVLVVGSASKGPMIALVAVSLTWLLGRVLRGEATKNVVKGSLAVFASIVVLGAIALAIDSWLGLGVLDRLGAGSSDYSTTDRLAMLDGALLQFERSPILGDAVVESVTRFYTHNLVVDTLMISGIVGFVLLTLMTLYCMAAGLRLLRTEHSWIALLYVQCALAAMFSGSAYFDAAFWGSSAIVLAADRLLKQTARPIEQAPPLAASPTAG